MLTEIWDVIAISIHALLAESDYTTIITIYTALKFLSTLSLRRATFEKFEGVTATKISIHALLAESDESSEDTNDSANNFYPRSPCGERLVYALILAHAMLFLSTLSLRRAT